VGPLALRELVPAGGEDLEGLLVEAREEGVLLDLGEAVEDGIVGLAVLSEPLGDGEAEEVGGAQEGAESEGVEAAALHGGAEQTLGEVV
jgi:hypothetical protein